MSLHLGRTTKLFASLSSLPARGYLGPHLPTATNLLLSWPKGMRYFLNSWPVARLTRILSISTFHRYSLAMYQRNEAEIHVSSLTIHVPANDI